MAVHYQSLPLRLPNSSNVKPRRLEFVSARMSSPSSVDSAALFAPSASLHAIYFNTSFTVTSPTSFPECSMSMTRGLQRFKPTGEMAGYYEVWMVLNILPQFFEKIHNSLQWKTRMDRYWCL